MSLQSIIQQIKTASLPGENTALRVGSAFEQMDAAKRGISDSLSKEETIDMVNSVKLLAATGTPFLGTIDPATTIPAGNFWAFASEGTYANAGGIVVGAGEIAIITRVGTAFDSVILDVPVKSIEDIEKTSTVGLVDTYTITFTDGSTPATFEITNGDPNVQIPDWIAGDYPEKSLTIKDNTIWRVADGQTAGVGDVPGVSDKWIPLGEVIQNITNNITEITQNVDPSQIVPSEALYNDPTETLASDILKRVDKSTGENVNYRETTTWHDGSVMDGSKVDGFLYKSINGKFYVDSEMIAKKEINILKFKEITDENERINFAVRIAPNGFTVNGYNSSFEVRTVWMKSNVIFKNFILKSKATNEGDISVIGIGNDVNPNNYAITHPMGSIDAMRNYDTFIHDIVIDNIVIDGNRIYHTNIDLIKNGSRQGIAIKGHVNNILINNCNVTMCVTDGIQIYRGLAYLVPNDSSFAFENIEVRNCNFSKNRRHGGSADSIKNAKFINCTFNDNGGVVAQTEGGNGSEYQGQLYGNGFDIEGYGLGSNVSDVSFIDCEFLRNQRSGVLMYDILSGTEVGFSKRINNTFKNCKFDSGQLPDNFRAFVCTVNQANIVYDTFVYENIILSNCEIEGEVLVKCVNNFIIDGGVQTFKKNSLIFGIFENTNAFNTSVGNIFKVEGYRAKITTNKKAFKVEDLIAITLQSNESTLLSVPFDNAIVGDKTEVFLSSINSSNEKDIIINSYVAFPANNILISIRNIGINPVTLDAGVLKLSLIKEFYNL